MADDTQFPIGIDTSAAVRAIEDLGKKIDSFGKNAGSSISDATKSMSTNFGNMSDKADKLSDGIGSLNLKFNIAAAVAIATKALGALGDAFGSAIDAAREKEDALTAVQSAMLRTGEYSKDSAKDIEAFADSLQETTGVADDMSLKLFAMAKNFGVSNEKAKDLTKAAIELSAATGQNLETALQSLGQSLDGTAGRLKESIPALRNMSEASLKAGGAIKYVLDQFSGSAEAKLKTFSGSLTHLEGAFDDLKSSLGEVIVKNPAVIAAINGLANVLGTLEEFVGANSDRMKDFISESLLAIVRQIPPVIRAFEFFAKSIEIVIGPFVELSSLIRPFFTDLIDGTSIIDTLNFAFLDFGSTLVGLLNTALSLGPALLSVIGIDLPPLDLSEQMQQLEDLKTALAERSIGTIAFSEGSTGDKAQKAAAKEDIFVGLEKTFEDLGDKMAETFNKQVDEKTQVPNVGGRGIAPDEPKKDSKEQVKGFGGSIGIAEILHFDELEKIGLSFLNNISGGEGGARKFVGDMAGNVAKIFGAGGPLAQAIGSIFELLGQDPETFANLINGFVAGIPKIIDNIVENIPTLIIAIAEHSGEIITALVSATPRIAIALAEAMPVVAEALLTQLVAGMGYQIEKFEESVDFFTDAMRAGVGDFKIGISQGFKDGMVRFQDYFINEFPGKIEAGFTKAFASLTTFFSNIGNAFYNAVSAAGAALINGLVNFVNQLNPSAAGDNSGLGKSKAFIKNLGEGEISLAQGGEFLVPPGYPNDSFRMNVSSGERVKVDPPGTKTDDGGMGADIVAVLGKILSVLQQPAGETTVAVQLNNDVLANAILSLNRRGARIS